MNIGVKRKFFLAVVAMLAAGSLVFAQTKVSVIIQCNVSGAQVYLNDNLAGSTSPTFTLQVFPGTYTIRVAKTGYSEFRTSIVAVQQPITIVANLSGGTPSTPPLFQPVPPPSLVPPSPTGRLFIDAGIRGAAVFINGAYVGTTPYEGIWPRGSYTVRISAPGYADYMDRVFLDGYTRLNISLSPLSVEYTIRLPASLSEVWERSDTFNELELFLDGNRLNSLYGRIRPGRHRFALIYRNLRFEDDFEVVPGKPATIELFFSLSVH